MASRNVFRQFFCANFFHVCIINKRLVQFQLFENSLVQINSKLNSKPYDYLHILDEVLFPPGIDLILRLFSGSFFRVPGCSAILQIGCCIDDQSCTVNSKLNSKPYDYLHILDEVLFPPGIDLILRLFSGSFFRVPGCSAILQIGCCIDDQSCTVYINKNNNPVLQTMEVNCR